MKLSTTKCHLSILQIHVRFFQLVTSGLTGQQVSQRSHEVKLLYSSCWQNATEGCIAESPVSSNTSSLLLKVGTLEDPSQVGHSCVFYLNLVRKNVGYFLFICGKFHTILRYNEGPFQSQSCVYKKIRVPYNASIYLII